MERAVEGLAKLEAAQAADLAARAARAAGLAARVADLAVRAADLAVRAADPRAPVGTANAQAAALQGLWLLE